MAQSRFVVFPIRCCVAAGDYNELRKERIGSVKIRCIPNSLLCLTRIQQRIEKGTNWLSQNSLYSQFVVVMTIASEEVAIIEKFEAINLITTTPDVRDGRPCIAGTTIEVAVIAIAKIVHGLSAEEIAAEYELSLPQVYAALAYYYEHKQQIDATIQERHKLAQEMKEKRVGSRHQPLFG